MLVQIHEVPGQEPDSSTLSERDRQSLAQTRKYLSEVTGYSVATVDENSDPEGVVLKNSRRPDGKSKRGVQLGEEADRRAARDARDARRKRMHIRRPDGSKRWTKITPDRQLKAYEDIAIETQDSHPDAQGHIAQDRYQASIGTATRHEVKRHLRQQSSGSNEVALDEDTQSALSLLIGEEFETVPVMVGGVHEPIEVFSLDALGDRRRLSGDGDIEDFNRQNNVDDALESGRRARHIARGHLATQWLDYGLARQDH